MKIHYTITWYSPRFSTWICTLKVKWIKFWIIFIEISVIYFCISTLQEIKSCTKTKGSLCQFPTWTPLASNATFISPISDWILTVSELCHVQSPKLASSGLNNLLQTNWNLPQSPCQCIHTIDICYYNLTRICRVSYSDSKRIGFIYPIGIVAINIHSKWFQP